MRAGRRPEWGNRPANLRCERGNDGGRTHGAQGAALRMKLSKHRVDRIARIARTIADLNDSIAVLAEHVTEAVAFHERALEPDTNREAVQ